MNDWLFYLALLVGIATLILWIWAIVDMLTTRYLRPGQRLFWGLVLFFCHLIGLALYVAFSGAQKDANRAHFQKHRINPI